MTPPALACAATRDGNARVVPGRVWAVVFGISALSGIAQLAILRELAASQALATLGLAIRLMLAVVLAAYGVGAALAPLLRGRDAARCARALGALLGVYLLALLGGFLRWLEPGLAARSVEPGTLLVLALLVSPPFAVWGLVLAHCTARVQALAPERVGALVALSLLGTGAGLLFAHAAARWRGVDSLLLLAALLALPVLCDRRRSALALLLAFCALPAESTLASLRASRPAFEPPLTRENTVHVYSGWSPYEKVDLYTFEDEILLGFYNGFWQWWSAARPDHAYAFPGYALLYQPDLVAGRDVLVIGAGAGMGVLALERSGPRSLTAVELDPLVVSLARGPYAAFNDRVYERVPVHAVEGRAYLDASRRRYDLVVYEGSFLTPTHPTVPISAESHLYTREGIRTALARLAPKGVALVLFAGPERALARVAGAIQAEGAALAALRLSYTGTLWWELPVLVFGRDAARVESLTEGVVARAGDPRRARRVALAPDVAGAVTDHRPFLYAGSPGETLPLRLGLGVAVALAGLGCALPGRRRLRAYYGLLGAAFMLLQTALISSFRSWLGDPVSTAYCVLLMLLAGMALGASRVERLSRLRRGPGCALGGSAVALAAAAALWLPAHALAVAWPLRLALAALGLVPLGVLLGVFFPLGLRRQPEAAVAEAYAWDALGSVAGFLLFPLLALTLGTPTALAVGAAGYAAAWLALPGR